ncbi:hypothetical protein [Flavobacterium hibernum]|uniref:Uncharacterized protein n=1 Tax=Flavobacterium hibernum TaxID=37752 RepID=A0A0D0EDK1_9FLAO|nr:hypothetical protein [Flavobacterium hibernum]KIO50744.1 hypothetical protein IW18_21555 [Flavobacterium hibernum]OXA84358.1 hypothetical protein B0A73_20030 [Flavobacterium hibernum]STO18710.1 Uncharacterised protein [Flavobacterium hibernum]
MIRAVIFLVISLCSFSLFAQTGINTRTPDASAALDITATDRGVITPQYTLTSLADNSNPVANPQNGSLIFNQGGTFTRGYYYWDGEKWNRMIVNSEMDKILNLKISGTYYADQTDQSKQLIPNGTSNNYISFTTAQTTYINTMGITNPNGTDITLPAGTYKVDISMDCLSPTAPASNYLISDKHLYVIDAGIVNSANTLLTDVKTVSSISNDGGSSVQGYSFSFVFKLTATSTVVKVLLRHGSGATTNVPTRTNQSGLVVNFYKMFE